VRLVPDTPPVPGEAASPDEVIAGLRVANTRRRELLAGRDAHIAHLLAQVAQLDELHALVADLQAEVADLAARVRQNSKNSGKPPSPTGWASLPRSRCGRRPAVGRAGPGASRV